MSFHFSHERINFCVPSKFHLSGIHQLYGVVAGLALLNAGLYLKNRNPVDNQKWAQVSETRTVPPVAAVAASAFVTNSLLLDRGPAQIAPAMPASNAQELILRSDRLFESGTATLSTQSSASIAQVQALIQSLDSASMIEIEGYTDNVPVMRQKKFYPSNWELSAARAAALIPFFENAGIAKGRLKIIGFGESRPLSSEPDPGSSHNRRLVIRVIPKGDVGI